MLLNNFKLINRTTKLDEFAKYKIRTVPITGGKLLNVGWAILSS